MAFVAKASKWIAESLIGMLAEKAADFIDQRFGANHRVQKDLKDLQATLLHTKSTISRVENMWIKDENLKQILKELLMQLKDAAYDADDLLDQFRCQVPKQQIEQRRDEASNPSSSFPQHNPSSSDFSSSLPPRKKTNVSFISTVRSFIRRENDGVIKLKEIKGRLDNITAYIKDVTTFSFEEGRDVITLTDADDTGKKQMGDIHKKTILGCQALELPNNENKVLPDLQLNYRSLPSVLKRCFAFLSLFPRDYRFTECELIHIWMAEGFLAPEGCLRMEDVGSNYFHELVSKSFFHKLEYENAYVMHDLMHDLAQLISVGEICRMDDSKAQPSSMVRHLSLFTEDVEPRMLVEFPCYHKLKTLMFPGKFKFKSSMLSYDLFARLKGIHVLVLKDCGLQEIADSIGELIHLRYLDISNNHIRRLPESLCELYNMQTLVLWDCELQELPQGMNKLINLRHLYAAEWIISNINEVGKLTALQELSTFKVLNVDGHKLAELDSLRQLHGRLRVTNLENIDSEEEASKATLQNKEYLDELELDWTSSKDSRLKNNALHVLDQVLESLHPHDSLKKLIIRGYNGVESPSWLEAKVLLKLESLKLENCGRWVNISYIKQISHLKFSKIQELALEDMMAVEDLSNIGQLPFLRILFIKGMPSMKKIGHEFFGNADQGECFPRLEELIFRDMPVLEEWSWTQGRVLFPSLHRLEIENSPKLLALPLLSQYESTMLSGSGEGITARIQKEWLLSHYLPNINEIQLRDCGGLVWMPINRFKELTSLKKLSIRRCAKLMTQDEEIDLHLPPSIKELELFDCGNLGKLLPDCLHNLNSLVQLVLGDCPNLVYLLSEPLHHLNEFESLKIENCCQLRSIEGLSFLKSLKSLMIKRCPTLLLNECIDLEKCLSLNDLEIDDTALLKLSPLRSALPSIHYLQISDSLQSVMFDGEDEVLLQELKSLRCLRFWNCRELQFLPTELHTLPSLQYLWIYRCPLIYSLPEKGLPTSLADIQLSHCHPMLKDKLEKHSKMNHRIVREQLEKQLGKMNYLKRGRLEKPTGKLSDQEELSSIEKSICLDKLSNQDCSTDKNLSLSSHESFTAYTSKLSFDDRMAKRRRTVPRRTMDTRNPTDSDDGYSWRKYGQKDILGAKNPREYYRCMYKNTEGCPALKQVERSEGDPPLFYVTYIGAHTCRLASRRSGLVQEKQQDTREQDTWPVFLEQGTWAHFWESPEFS